MCDRGAGRHFSADRRSYAQLWGPGGPRHERGGPPLSGGRRGGDWCGECGGGDDPGVPGLRHLRRVGGPLCGGGEHPAAATQPPAAGADLPGAGCADVPAGARTAPGNPAVWDLCDRQRPPQSRRRIFRRGRAGRRTDPGLPGAGGGADGTASVHPAHHPPDGVLSAGLCGDEGLFLLHWSQRGGLGDPEGDAWGDPQRRPDPAAESVCGRHRRLYHV